MEHQVLFVIASQDIYKSLNSDCYIVFGEAKVCTDHHYSYNLCQEWILKLFEVKVNRVRSGFECEMRIQLESKLSQRTVMIQFGCEFGVALETYCRAKEISSCSPEV